MSKVSAERKRELLRALPSVNELLALEPLATAQATAGRGPTTNAVRATLSRVRRAITSGELVETPSREELTTAALRTLAASSRPACRHVVNATGVIIHTGLGRAVLPEAVLHAIAREARGYCLLETDQETGRRGKRQTALCTLLCQLTGAEAALVVNNNAAATLLCLSVLAKGREVIVSRGELVEIGGSFRIPEILAQSGAVLREVGTTNRTRVADYEAAITEKTALLLRVHPSNFRILGFTERPSLAELVELGRRHSIPVMDDIGSGALIDLSPYGFPHEPTMPRSVRQGADVVCASADKLLGGCQAGIIVGRHDLVSQLERSPLYRALRVDKLTVIALEATLRLYLDPDTLLTANPTMRMITEPLEACARRASRIARAIRQARPEAEVAITSSRAQIGSGSVPGETLPTKVVAVRVPGISTDDLARRLRKAEPPIFTRVREDRVLIDAKTVLPDEITAIADAFRALA